jgi:flagellar basal body-associated protein FliL
MEPESLSEEEEFEWHERLLKRIAMEESKHILQRMAEGYKPDIMDRILLRMAQKERKSLKSTKKESKATQRQ